MRPTSSSLTLPRFAAGSPDETTTGTRGRVANAMRIIVVEDERKVASFIRQGLEEEGYAVEVAHDGETALDLIASGPPSDLIVLDLMLPRLDGFAVLKAARSRAVPTPVLVVTARDGVADKVKGLDLGADDYLTKPFSFDEFLARVRALLRRSSGRREPVLRLADLSLDPATREVSRAGRRITLTAREYALLEYFLRSCGRVSDPAGAGRARLGPRLRPREQHHRCLRRVSPAEDRRRRRAATSAHRSRGRLRAEDRRLLMRWKPPTSIHTRLTLWYTGVLLIILLVTSGFSYWLLALALTRDTDPVLLELAEVVRESVTAGRGGSGASEAVADLESGFRDQFVQVVDAQGVPTYLSARLKGQALPLSAAARDNAQKGKPTFETLRFGSRQMRLVTLPVVRRGRPAEVVQVAGSLARSHRALARYLRPS